jgi:hypothetical protein
MNAEAATAASEVRTGGDQHGGDEWQGFHWEPCWHVRKYSKTWSHGRLVMSAYCFSWKSSRLHRWPDSEI